MGAKLYADSATKTLVVTEAPDGDDFVYLNAQEEVWSDLIIDWESDLTLRGHTFPVRAIGGDTISAGKLGTTYVLAEPWQIEPYEADHDFVIDGNLFTELTLTKLVLPTVGNYTVTVTRNLSTLVEIVQTDVSGLTTQESQALIDIALAVDGLVTDVAALTALNNLLKDAQDLTNEQANAEHITSRSTGQVILRNTTVSRRWEAWAYEDEGKSILYGTNPNVGIEAVGVLVEVAWS